MIKAALLLLPVLGLGACASEIGAFGGDSYAANQQLGQAVRQNIAAQSVNSSPSSSPVVADATRTVDAVTAYRKDAVEKPSATGASTSKISGGN
jgi:hypothetical protein